jgi:hypothetical protein
VAYRAGKKLGFGYCLVGDPLVRAQRMLDGQRQPQSRLWRAWDLGGVTPFG